jgi:signal transduction histidine kinase
MAVDARPADRPPETPAGRIFDVPTQVDSNPPWGGQSGAVFRDTLGEMRRRDLGIAVAAFAATVALMYLPESDEANQPAEDPDALAFLLAALASFPLLAWRRAPVLVFVATAVASSALFLLGYPEGPPVGPTVALYFVAYSRPEGGRRTALTLGLVATLLVFHITLFGIGRDRFPGGELLLGVLLWTTVWIAADRTRLRRERMAELEERAARAEREAERERRLATAEERGRIARDLHDSAGHAINVILVQAGAARLNQERDPRRAREALETIEEVARETIHEIDRLVGALREKSSPDAIEPPPGLAAVDSLADRHRAAGLEVDIQARGARRALSRSTDQAAYRILQEALTNAAKHGHGGAEVEIDYGERALEIKVTNPASPGEAEPRHGLIGMHERAALLGGIVDVSADNGVFRLRARLPYAEPESE